jgi:hypothetical protein
MDFRQLTRLKTQFESWYGSLPADLANALNKTTDATIRRAEADLELLGRPRRYTKRKMRVVYATADGLRAIIEDEIWSRAHKPIRFRGWMAYPASTRGTKDFAMGRTINYEYDRPRPAVMLRDKKQYFMGPVKGVMGIWKRTGTPDSHGWPRPHLNLMYALTPPRRRRRRKGDPVLYKAAKRVAETAMPDFIEQALDANR